jgi:hypothetical protein
MQQACEQASDQAAEKADGAGLPLKMEDFYGLAGLLRERCRRHINAWRPNRFESLGNSCEQLVSQDLG